MNVKNGIREIEKMNDITLNVNITNMLIEYLGKKYDTSQPLHKGMLLGLLKQRLKKGYEKQSEDYRTLDGDALKKTEKGIEYIKELIKQVEAIQTLDTRSK